MSLESFFLVLGLVADEGLVYFFSAMNLLSFALKRKEKVLSHDFNPAILLR
jgi:hypothetical protein